MSEPRPQLPGVELVADGYRSTRERVLVVPDGNDAAVLAEMHAAGWRVVGRQGSGYVLERG